MSNVSEKLLLKSFRIYKLITDFELLDDGENEVSLTTRMGTMIPKEDADNECKVEILVEFKNNREDTILSVVARGGFEIPPKFDTRACLKNHSRHLHAPLCDIFVPGSVSVAHYTFFTGGKSPTNCDAHLTESIFQTRPRIRKNNFCKNRVGNWFT